MMKKEIRKKQRMKLYRSIGEKELRGLLEGQMIYGMFNCQKEHQNNSYLKNACCFYVDEVRWNDANHIFMLVLEIPEERLTFGIVIIMLGNL